MARGIHRLLTHRILTVAGWVTLTGLLSRRPPAWLWLLRLIPLTIYLLIALGAVNMLLSDPEYIMVVLGLALYGYLVQIAFSLVVMLRGRDELELLDEQLAKLDQLARCSSPARHRSILLRLATLVTITTISCGLWVSFPMATGEYTHPNYLIAVELPQALQTQRGYWYCLALQIVAVVFSCTLTIAFDCSYFLWLNAINFHLVAIRESVEAFFSTKSGCTSKSVEKIPFSVTSIEEGLGSLQTLSGNEDLKYHRSSSPSHEQQNQDEKRIDMLLGSTVIKVKQVKTGVDKSDEEVRKLAMIDLHYDQVAALCRTVNRFSGSSVLLMHASTMTVVLFGIYACILLASSGLQTGLGTQLAGLSVFAGIFILRIILISVDGGRITEESEELAASLESMQWIHLSRAARERREALLQKTTRPLRLSAAGVFTINKINILNIFSFMLTYLVVIVQ